MPAQFLLNLCIALLWMLLNDESELRFSTFLAGYLVGAAIVFLMHRLFGERFYLMRFFAVIKLLLIFNWELLQSSYHIIKQILSPKLKIRPGIFKYETELRGEWEITALALLLTLTPGSVVLEVTPEGDAYYIHAMDVEQSMGNLIRSLYKFEKAIMEVTR
ncbi:Na+/H+ antiporter subunit E [Virgibacillus sp. NKC19-16]|uniref:Na+/H+ antiporter subunit E n=1 Tax=Virgibacillus salidurans TaxID=2831673 RepID=UPI001F3788A0|nr:Na+/H+ antiporter subunit E [Virgibacillus sp. NKC19-16]UJL46236.1 Na+/H+ antiporter subunit E [Virgibacillus sp. NKC19-16]